MGRPFASPRLSRGSRPAYEGRLWRRNGRRSRRRPRRGSRRPPSGTTALAPPSTWWRRPLARHLLPPLPFAGPEAAGVVKHVQTHGGAAHHRETIGDPGREIMSGPPLKLDAGGRQPRPAG